MVHSPQGFRLISEYSCIRLSLCISSKTETNFSEVLEEIAATIVGMFVAPGLWPSSNSSRDSSASAELYCSMLLVWPQTKFVSQFLSIMSLDSIRERSEVSVPALMRQSRLTHSQISDCDVAKLSRCIHKFSCFRILASPHRIALLSGPWIRILGLNPRRIEDF